MSEHNIDIADMQCWVFRMAQTKWNMPAKDCVELFKKYNIFDFIACALADVETLLKNRGVTV